MSSSDQSNRLHAFGTNEADPVYEATVRSAQSLSPTIRQFFLSIDDPAKTFRFRPGMFLDFYLPPSVTSIITGFSICNSPADYARTGLVELAIKGTDYPPTKYMCHDCRVNEVIPVKPGGDFTYEPSGTNDESVLLICAGIGANPIVSILRHIRDAYQSDGGHARPHRVAFLYTASTAEELVFRPSIDSSCQQMIDDNVLQTNYFVTREINDDGQIHHRRINATDLQGAIQWLAKPVTTYLCGPAAFIDWTENTLKGLGVTRILYEKWW